MRKDRGFTLIELLVVIAIIGLLSTLAVVALNNARQKSRDAKRIADIKQMQTALELYFNDNNGYPAQATAGTLTTIATSGVTYMAVVPTAPTPADGSVCQTGTNNSYEYQSTTSNFYNLSFCLGAQTGGVSGNAVHTATPAGIQ